MAYKGFKGSGMRKTHRKLSLQEVRELASLYLQKKILDSEIAAKKVSKKDEEEFTMKYAIKVEETMSRTIIVEAENLDDAIEMVENAANNDKILFGIEDFVGREIKPSDKFEGGIVPDGKDVSFYEHLKIK